MAGCTDGSHNFFFWHTLAVLAFVKSFMYLIIQAICKIIYVVQAATSPVGWKVAACGSDGHLRKLTLEIR